MARARSCTCPALGAAGSCDDASTLRGEILHGDALRAHAVEVARQHGEPKPCRQASRLRERFLEVRTALDTGYAELAAASSPVDAASAEEWLLDNRHVVQEQVREFEDDLPRGYLRTLPCMGVGNDSSYPRVYAATVDYLRHTGARLDPESLALYVEGYQTVSPLTIGELWAIPIMMRLGLLADLSTAARWATTHTGRDRAARATQELSDHPDRTTEILARIEREGVDARLVVNLWRLLSEHEVSAQTIHWIRDRAVELGGSPEELAHRLHVRQATDQVAVANAIASMRTIGTYDWSKFFERTSIVERILSGDRGGVYSATDAASRDRYRHVVERVALRSKNSEANVAKRALELASRHEGGARAHAGYYLEHDGLCELERACGARLTAREWVARALTRHPRTSYFTFVIALTTALAALEWDALRNASSGAAPALIVTWLLVLAASEVALSTIGALVVAILPPRLLSRLALDEGVTPAHRTLVVVPVLFDSLETIDRLVAELEVRALANPDPDLHFALLSDFCDASHEREPNDDALVERATAGLLALNTRYPLTSGLPKYALFHRKRVRNDSQGCFMGWERKRGKLEELNRLLLGQGPTTFTTMTAPRTLLSTIQYVITLDADTNLPRTAAMRLVATLAHPLNRPVLSADGTRVVEGYAVIQPRVGTVPSSARRSRFARVAAGPAALDPYTGAVSDVYQDLFGEGSYIGKAIYDVRAFAAVHDGRTPENRLLSHDLFEGILARTAFASDIELLDEQPASYGAVARRAHRWMRGDWQLVSLLGLRRGAKGAEKNAGQRSLGLVGLWKVVDNLRRSLLGPSSVVAFVLACEAWPAAAARVALVLAAMVAAPIALRIIAALLRRGRAPSSYDGLWSDLQTLTLNALLVVVLFFDQAVVAFDAIVRSLYRLIVSKQNLLEWRSTGLDANGVKTPMRMWIEIPVLAAGIASVAWAHGAVAIAAPVMGLWMLAPPLVAWLGRPLPTIDRAARLTEGDRNVLRVVARKTWHFFETFVTKEDHWLPPDNFQEEPRAVVAHRTSPTNVGLYLLSVLSARDLGYVGSFALVQRLARTLDTMDRLEKHEGHILNWYDTRTLKPLEPRYVSTVDSGNLAAYLWVVHRSCQERIDLPILGPEMVTGVTDALRVDGATTGGEWSGRAESILSALESSVDGAPQGPWTDRARDTRAQWLEEIEQLVPHLRHMSSPPEAVSALPAFRVLRGSLGAEVTLRAMVESTETVQRAKEELASRELGDADRAWMDELFARLRRGSVASAALMDDLGRVAERAWALARAMNFAFLYDADRSLFSIGYNVSTARLDGSRYDLLASEARLASFVAIAKGDVPEKHWFHLSRARCRVEQGRALLSWSGSMFEYLMPLLVLRSFPDSLLDETHVASVKAQRAYGRKRGVPWGISEAAFNVMDLSMTYQYRAFGVPALGLKPGLDEDLVVAPYATALAAMIDPEAAVRNMNALSAEGLSGEYGFYDSIDYTPSRVPARRRGVVVKTFMAHHLGMSFVSLAGVLDGAPMQRRFHSVPRVKATELLLQERVPTGVPIIEARASHVQASAPTGHDTSQVEVVGLERQGLARAHLLGHGELASIVSSVGTGVLTWRGLDVGRFHEDQRVDPAGTFLYVRDGETGDSWSAGFEPTRVKAASYGATFTVDRVEIHRKDHDIETSTEIVVSPEQAVEVRRISLTNHGDRARDITVTTYTEVALAQRSADQAHRAFSNLFVEVEEHAALGAIVASRRPRPGEDLRPWVAQALLPETDGFGPVQIESSRESFLGRGGDVCAPAGLSRDLHGILRHPLDPALILRRTVTIAPHATARLCLVTGVAPSRDEVVGLIQAYSGSAPVDRAFELAWADARVELKHLGVGAAQSFRFQRLLSFVLDPHSSLRETPAHEGRGDGRAALWSCGISGDLPLVVLRVDGGEVTDLCREVLVAHEFFRLNHFSMDLLVLNEEPAGYLQPVQDELSSLVLSSFAQGHLDQRGGVFVRKSSSVDEHTRALILTSARVVLRTSAGSLARQLRIPPVESKAMARTLPRPATVQCAKPPPLVFDNGIGGFTRDGREYVVYGKPPAPWSNVLANPGFGTLVTERGGGFTWATNSQSLRLTPWSNDAVSDPRGEAVYIANDSGDVWTASDGLASHAASGSTFEGRACGVHHTLSITVPTDAPVKLSKLSLENETDAPLHLTVSGYVEWVLGTTREASRLTTITRWDADLGTVFVQNAGSPRSEGCAFFRATRKVARMTCDRAEFFADFSSRSGPAGAVVPASGASGAALDPCAVLQIDVTLPPRGAVTLAFVLGQGKDAAEARVLAQAWGDGERVDRAFEDTRHFWEETLGAVQVETPDRALDLMVNGWLLQQVLACRLWGRSAFYQSGGAYGYRDQLQDVLALLHARPDLAREHLLRAAARQFEEGDVQHWWHPEDGAGVRTHCADDMLWLPFATLEYVRVTGDRTVLDEEISFLADQPVPKDQKDVFTTPRTSSEKGSLYEHCARAIEAGLTVGPHGLPLMRGGDWNDGMDRVGAGGTGESVWLAWFLVVVLRDFAPVADTRGDKARAARWHGETTRLAGAVEEHAWDGAWYRRGYFDDGSPLGSESSPECRIDAIAQSWAVLAGSGDPARARRAVTEAESRLVRDDPAMMLLLTPAFDGKGPDPGYIRAYPPGIRENGGQYTHGVLWTVQALAMLGEGERAHALFSKLNPAQCTSTRGNVDRYAVEPYVLAGDVYSDGEHDGRGGWSWYTGAAGWMYRIALHWLLGLHLEGARLSIRPCVPPSWERYTIRLRRGTALYEIVVVPGPDLTVDVDGQTVGDGVILLKDDGAIHTVLVRSRGTARLAG